MNRLVEDREIPGAVLVVQQQHRCLLSKSYGAYTAEDWSKHIISKNTLFDLASLTKVVATLPAILLLISRDRLNLMDSAQKHLPDFRFPHITIQHLLQHSSGLPADLEPSVRRHHQRDIMQEVLACNVIGQPNEQVIYSDLGMILLGKIIENIAGQSFQSFIEQEISKPWGMHHTSFRLHEQKKGQAAATEMVSGKFVQGIVHDEKALLLEGVSGSAGLFSCADDLAKYAKHWLGITQQSTIPFEWMELAYTKTIGNRGLGFEVWNGDHSLFCFGRGWSKGSFGHTGFTGTSIWMDPIKKAFVILLTNAVHYGRNTRIREIREKLHTMIYENLIT